jgi:hypothetical protein
MVVAAIMASGCPHATLNKTNAPSTPPRLNNNPCVLHPELCQTNPAAGSVGGACLPPYAGDRAWGPHCNDFAGCDQTRNVCVACGTVGLVCCDGPSTCASGTCQTSPMVNPATVMCRIGICNEAHHCTGACGDAAGARCCIPDPTSASARCTPKDASGTPLMCQFDAGTITSGTCVKYGIVGAPPCPGSLCNGGIDLTGVCQACSNFQISNVTFTFNAPACPRCADGAFSFSTSTPFPVRWVVRNTVNAIDMHQGVTAATQLTVVGLQPGQTYALSLTPEDSIGNTCPTVFGPTLALPPDAVGPAGGCAAVHLTNHGDGPPPSPTTLVPLLWGSDGDNTLIHELDVTYRQLENSNYYKWVRNEYGAPALQHTMPAGFHYYGYLQSGMQLKNSDLLSQLDDAIRSNTIKEPVNAVYVIHLPPGVTLTFEDGSVLCTGPNAKHLWRDTFDALRGGQKTRYYITLLDPSTCSLTYNGLTTAMSHEISEAMTDAHSSGYWDATQPGNCGGVSATSQCGTLKVTAVNNAGACPSGVLFGGNCYIVALGPCPPSGPEIADVCTGRMSAITTPYLNTIGGVTTPNLIVQKLWSMKMNACVTEDSPNAELR